MANNDETIVHGGGKDTENHTQKVVASQTSTVRKAIAQTRPPINQAEIIARTLFPKQ